MLTFNSMEKFLEANSEEFLVDPLLFDSFFSVVKKRVPVFIKDNVLYSFVKNEDKEKSEYLALVQKEVDQDLLNEKLFLIKNYKKWLETRTFSKEAPTRAIIDFILIEAILNNISDIHFNVMSENEYVINFKKETVLSFFCNLTKTQFDSVLLCFKVISSLDTAKRYLPQSSSFCKFFRGESVDFRISTHPTFFGERFVIRVLSRKSIYSYKDMNLVESVLADIEKVISVPNGLVLFTGPTNSGKTTLIHSIIREISKSNLAIMTLEDPVEYRVNGIIQTNVSENGLSFYEGMRSVLRQDPDVVFLGEIRDHDTAKIAVQAALTGHKVLSTLHAYSIKGAIARLLDMGISRVMLAESLTAVFSQRLLKRAVFDSCSSGVVLLADSLFMTEKVKDFVREGLFEGIKDGLRQNAEVLLKEGIVTDNEVKRVLG